MKIIVKRTRTKFSPMAVGLAVGCISLASALSAAADTTNAPEPGPEVTGRRAHLHFWDRFDKANMDALGSPSNPPPDTNAPPSKRRPLPAPFDAPPYPNGEWQIGGTEIIGDMNNTPDYPLMQAVYDGPHG